MAQSTSAYAPAKTAVQSQLDALGGQLNTAKETINRNYAQQQAQLENQRNQAAEAASLSAPSFGGAANVARRKYYEQTFVPAQTQLQTNQANDIAQAQQNYENQRTSLNAQLANLDAQANQQALQQFWAQQEAEKNRQAARASNPFQYTDDGYGNNGVRAWDFGNGYKVFDDNGEAVYSLNGNQITRGQFLEGTSKGGRNWDLWNDIWNSGTRTEGVGSDTIEAYGGLFGGGRNSFNNAISQSLQKTNKYSYLY